MKSLKQRVQESILGSTKSGKSVLVQKWIDENLPNCNLTVNAQGKIAAKDNYNVLHIDEVDEFPDYISFADTDNGFYLGTVLDKKIKREQLPEYANWWYISGKSEKIENFKCKAGKIFSVNEYPQNLKEIHNIEITFKEGANSEINLNNTNIGLDSLQQIKTNVYRIHIENTPASHEIMNIIKRIQRKATTEWELDEKLDDLFSNLKGTRFIKLSSRKSLEHNPKNGHWYYF